MASNDDMLIWLPNGVAGELVAGLTATLNANGYDTRLELAPIGRGKRMRINAVKRKYGRVITLSDEGGVGASHG